MGAMVQLDISASRKRDFYFDHAFGPSSTQDHVYNTIARPVVDGVLNGFNGTVFAYGQTGTGKTYTMGILNQLRGQSTAGIVPCAVEHIFESERCCRQETLPFQCRFCRYTTIRFRSH